MLLFAKLSPKRPVNNYPYFIIYCNESTADEETKPSWHINQGPGPCSLPIIVLFTDTSHNFKLKPLLTYFDLKPSILSEVH